MRGPSAELKKKLAQRIKINQLKRLFKRRENQYKITAPQVRGAQTDNSGQWDPPGTEPMGEREFEFEMKRPYRRR